MTDVGGESKRKRRVARKRIGCGMQTQLSPVWANECRFEEKKLNKARSRPAGSARVARVGQKVAMTSQPQSKLESDKAGNPFEWAERRPMWLIGTGSSDISQGCCWGGWTVPRS